jgi:hypothetical protein
METTTLPSGTIKRIHVNKHLIAQNRKNGTKLPVYTCKTSKGNFRGHHCVIKGQSVLVYSPEKPLSCGAWVWIETKAEVEIQMEQ